LHPASQETQTASASAGGESRRRVVRRLRNLVWLLARPVRRGRRERDLVIQPYRGFGSPERLLLEV